MDGWKREFGEDYAIPQELEDRFDDRSWHNDSSPSFLIMEEGGTDELIHNEDGSVSSPDAPPYYWLAVWVEHPDKEQRELDLARFEIVLHGDDINGIGLGSSEELDEEFLIKLHIVEQYAKAHGLAHIAKLKGISMDTPVCSCGNRNMASMGMDIICSDCHKFCGEIH